MPLSVYNFLIGCNISLSRIVEEIPGLSKQYDMEFFRNLENKCGIRLENIVYYKVPRLKHIQSLILLM